MRHLIMRDKVRQRNCIQLLQILNNKRVFSNSSAIKIITFISKFFKCFLLNNFREAM